MHSTPSPVLPCLQIWHLQPDTQTEVNLALKEMQRMTRPIVAFHVRGNGRDENLLFDVRASALLLCIPSNLEWPCDCAPREVPLAGNLCQRRSRGHE